MIYAEEIKDRCPWGADSKSHATENGNESYSQSDAPPFNPAYPKRDAMVIYFRTATPVK